MFQGTAGRQTLIRVNSTPSLEGSRVITVVPVASDDALRTRAWIENNRRLVDKLSGGRLAYVWLPNTGMPGYTAFNRLYYAQQNKEGAVIDERYNQGGMVADYIVNELNRPLMGYFARRDGKPSPSPMVGIYGPKVMIINESAGSGGDALPYYFKQQKIGPLVGTRTWGALVGTLGIPATIDGGGITAPSLAFYDVNGRWAIENEGVAPDIEVEITPADAAAGRDPQLERAVQEAMKLLEKTPAKRVPRPAPIDRTSPPRRHRPGQEYRMRFDRSTCTAAGHCIDHCDRARRRRARRPPAGRADAHLGRGDDPDARRHPALHPDLHARSGATDRCRSSFSGRPTAWARTRQPASRRRSSIFPRTATTSSCRTFAAASSPRASS